MAHQMQRQRQEQAQQDTPTETQSVNLVRNLLNTTIGAITYLRVVFAEDHYKDTNVNGMSLKSLERGHSKEADDLIDWLNGGVFDALDKKYLRTLIFGIYANPDEPEHLLETYTFNFSYPSEGQTHVSFVTDGKQPFHFKTKKEIMKATSEMLRRLLTLTQSLGALPDNANITMKIYYYDEVTPEDYEPPFFIACDHNKPYYFTHKPEKLGVGTVETAYHALSLRLQYFHDDPEGDQPMIPAAEAGQFIMEEDEQPIDTAKSDQKKKKTDADDKVAPAKSAAPTSQRSPDAVSKPVAGAPVSTTQQVQKQPPPVIQTTESVASSVEQLPLPQFTPVSKLGSVGTQELISALKAGTATRDVAPTGGGEAAAAMSEDETANDDMESESHSSHNESIRTASSHDAKTTKTRSRAELVTVDNMATTSQDCFTRGHLAGISKTASTNGVNSGDMNENTAVQQPAKGAKKPVDAALLKKKVVTKKIHSCAHAKDIDAAQVSCACCDNHAEGIMIECCQCGTWSHAICFGFLTQEDALASTDEIRCYHCLHGQDSRALTHCFELTIFRRALIAVWKEGCESPTWLSTRLGGLDEGIATQIIDLLKKDGILRPISRRGRPPKKAPKATTENLEYVNTKATIAKREYWMSGEAWKHEFNFEGIPDIHVKPRAAIAGGGGSAGATTAAGKENIMMANSTLLPIPPTPDDMDVDSPEDMAGITAGSGEGLQKRTRSEAQADGESDGGSGRVRTSGYDFNNTKRRKVSVAAKQNRRKA
ncbi:hypothetical protein SmJEL517_g05132 [Synchytrium microbalum]|uniref:HORMA domain-containing protein n=1 Tax=Synchytrium microbalum TaxID=1806994 RepID=A0A507BMW6_9FUNG|nr:uncharacterized protein SmJEL517_g05132 [Synchytrium microbalum]TPX31520.1 hypothetical protein SmJEL517_g05132 [Synchytrium microbalum]